ncbi:low-density lipoprotein receptor-like [Mytilus edulis]|uniref:low-density lipoprotein receptor-like n=1 Tax=Mytilus edulis TaxID=6550 RepID=UPI0039EFB119
MECLQNKLIYSTKDTIKEIDLRSGNVSVLLQNLKSNIYSLDCDYKNGYIYFPKHDLNVRSRFRYPSDKPYKEEDMTTAAQPISLVVDPVSENVYWTELYTGWNLNGINKACILQDDNVYAITLDYRNRWLYYSTFGTTRQIKRARLNGSEKHPILESVEITGLGIDTNGWRLYYMIHHKGELKSSSLNGTNIIDVFSTNKTRRNIGIYVYDSNIYCTNDLQLLKVASSQAATSYVIHEDTAQTLGVLLYDEMGRYKPILIEEILF